MQDFLTNCANVLQKYGFSYLRGAGTTLLLALVGTFFGCLIGFAVGALQTIPIDKQRDPAWKRVPLRILRVVLRCYVELFRGTPMIVQAVFIYYGLLQVFGIKMGMWTAGFFIVSINTGAYMAEIGPRRHRLHRPQARLEGAHGYRHERTAQTMLHGHPARRPCSNIRAVQIGNNFIIDIKDTFGAVGRLHHRPVLRAQERGRRAVQSNSLQSAVIGYDHPPVDDAAWPATGRRAWKSSPGRLPRTTT